MKTYRGKYTPLFRHLTEFNGQQWRATFKAVEVVLGFSLPKSARRHPAWWAAGHSHAHAWLAAGWRTRAVDLAAETLVFEQRQRVSIPRRDKPAPGMAGAALAADIADSLTLGGQTFRHVAPISPATGPDGKPLEEMPQRRYRAAASTPLNSHGRGPFCRFSVAGLPATSGVYAVTVEQDLVYVGIATDLKRRWGLRATPKSSRATAFREANPPTAR